MPPKLKVTDKNASILVRKIFGRLLPKAAKTENTAQIIFKRMFTVKGRAGRNTARENRLEAADTRIILKSPQEI